LWHSAASPQALSFQPSAFSPEARCSVGAYRRSSAAHMVFRERANALGSATKPLKIVAPRKEFEV
jgi:hypothetical protein